MIGPIIVGLCVAACWTYILMDLHARRKFFTEIGAELDAIDARQAEFFAELKAESSRLGEAHRLLKAAKKDIAILRVERDIARNYAVELRSTHEDTIPDDDRIVFPWETE